MICANFNFTKRAFSFVIYFHRLLDLDTELADNEYFQLP